MITEAVTAYFASPEQAIAESSTDDNMYELDEMLRHLYETAEALDRLTAGKMPGSICVEWQGKRQSISMLAPAAFRYIAKKIDRTASYDYATGEIVRPLTLEERVAKLEALRSLGTDP